MLKYKVNIFAFKSNYAGNIFRWVLINAMNKIKCNQSGKTNRNPRHSFFLWGNGDGIVYVCREQKSVKNTELEHILVISNTFAMLKERKKKEKKIMQAKWQSRRNTKLPNEKEDERQRGRGVRKQSFRFKEIIHLVNSL